MHFPWTAGARRFYQRHLPLSSFLILAAWTIYAYTFHIYSPVEAYMAIFALVASALDFWPPRLRLDKAAWFGVYCFLTLFVLYHPNSDKTKNYFPYVDVGRPTAGSDDWQVSVVNDNPDHVSLPKVIIVFKELPLPGDSDEEVSKKITRPADSIGLDNVPVGDWGYPKYLKPGLYQISLITINNRFQQQLYIARDKNSIGGWKVSSCVFSTTGKLLKGHCDTLPVWSPH